MFMKIYAATDPGFRRSNNEDHFISLSGSKSPGIIDSLMIVADGMGGHRAGEVASKMASENLVRHLSDPELCNTILTGDSSESLRDIISKINTEIYISGQEPEFFGMGTTLTVAMRLGEIIHIGHVGDSRAYLLRDQTLTLLTTDHTWVAMQVAEGYLTKEEASIHPRKNILMQALGSAPEVDIETKSMIVEPNDQFLLCSDGLSTLVDDDNIGEVMIRVEPAQAVSDLINLAKDAGGTDNITVVVGKVIT